MLTSAESFLGSFFNTTSYTLPLEHHTQQTHVVQCRTVTAQIAALAKARKQKEEMWHQMGG